MLERTKFVSKCCESSRVKMPQGNTRRCNNLDFAMLCNASPIH